MLLSLLNLAMVQFPKFPIFGNWLFALSVHIFSLVFLVACAQVVGGFLYEFLCPGYGLVFSLFGMLVNLLVCPVCGV